MERERPVISFLTDFGPESAPAICRGVMIGIARDAQVIDISHSVRKYAIRDGAYLLWSAVPWLPVGVHVAVVDPGVGTARRPIGILTARGDVLIGPDNGVLMPAAAALGGITQARVLENRDLMLPRLSSTFHGRDLFAPIAAHLATGRPFDDVGPRIATAALTAFDFPAPRAVDGGLETEVAYVDSFGNLRLFGTTADLERALGRGVVGAELEVTFSATGEDAGRSHIVRWARTFGEVATGSALLYEDSSGWLALADNQGNAAARIGIGNGTRVRLHSARSRGGG